MATFGHRKAQLWIQGQQQVRTNDAFREHAGKHWFHVASLGEYEQTLPIIETFDPKEVVVTFFSPSGYEVIQKRNPIYPLFYLPLPTRARMRSLLSILQPASICFTKYDLWWSLIYEAQKKGIPSYLIAGKLKEKDFGIRFSQLGKNLFRLLDKIHVQDSHSSELLAGIGIESNVSGDPRYDRVKKIAEQGFSDDRIAAWSQHWDQVVVVGSAWKPEIELVAQIIEELPNTGFIIAPHELNHGAEALRGLQLNHVHLSDFGPGQEATQILNIDQFGLLSSLYRFGDFALIGGGFGKGIHNTLEAAVYGIGLAFGPNHRKFTEAQTLLSHKAALELGHDPSILIQLLHNKDELLNMGKQAQLVCDNNFGATQKILSCWN